MTAFTYRDGVLCADSVSLADIAAKVGTPFYVYSETRLRENFREFHSHLADLNPLICFAVKANPNVAVIKILADCGAGADITSAGELERAVKAGIPPQKIIFSGVGKTRDEIAIALKLGIFQLNAESIPEMRIISEVAASLNLRAPLTLRVNPNVAAHTHFKLATGEMGTKFGIDSAQLDEAMELTRTLPALDLKGFQVHVGTHLFDYGDFREAYTKLADMVRFWRGKGFALTRLDLGGGVGIPYDGRTQAPFSEYAQIVHETVGKLGCELAFEPGRRLVGDAGALVSRVVYDKRGVSKRFLILDAGMNDLIRPAMYEARHSIVPVREGPVTGYHNSEPEPADVVGPVCETSDLFGENYLLPGVGQGDLVAILQGGAYGAAMSSNYNGRALVPEVLTSGDKFRTIRRRITVTEQIGWEE
ncbi:MAG: diaminopimelate decarboxylase [Alphaproteobacteria bacterium]|nr:diaminopimelate decarboxylase [Alphaproteobacteria bacterium]